MFVFYPLFPGSRKESLSEGPRELLRLVIDYKINKWLKSELYVLCVNKIGYGLIGLSLITCFNLASLPPSSCYCGTSLWLAGELHGIGLWEGRDT